MDLKTIAIVLPGVVAGLTLHEFMHAYAAKRCGDDTAEKDGRISLNPLKHIDLMGFIFLLIAGFGWAKPVMISEEKFRRPRLASAIISLAGPFSNVFLALLLTVLFIVLAANGFDSENSRLMQVVLYGIFINWGLFVFNMIPIPPLDGSHLIFHSFRKNEVLYAKIYRYGTGILFGILILQSVADIEILHIGPAIRWLGIAGIKMIGAVYPF